MLADQPRLDAYKAAIEEVVQPGDQVIDAGTGSGILACMAARAGAGLVQAVDNSDILALTAQVVERSQLGASVRCVRSEIKDFVCAEPVDVIVTETFGAFALAEGSLPDLAACATKNLKPSGVVIPHSISLYLAPTHDRSLYEEAFGPFSRQSSADLGPLIEAARQRAITLQVSENSLLCPGSLLWRFAYPQESPADPAKTRFTVSKDATLYGFVGWFILHLSPSHDLDTGPGAPPTHWHQVYFPVEGVAIPAGETLACEVLLSQAPDDPRGLEVRLTYRTESASHKHFFRIR
jgi:protein arginine N-methyltransferase 1